MKRIQNLLIAFIAILTITFSFALPAQARGIKINFPVGIENAQKCIVITGTQDVDEDTIQYQIFLEENESGFLDLRKGTMTTEFHFLDKQELSLLLSVHEIDLNLF